ncbi:calcium-binding protein [Teichococcus vastitatis]|uniref:Calcium-binding protein n=1 Tax=Teichococcus vastitatis TaxID=2307076 RepID=A0ABS9W7R8_9PROT|nr:hypothetical protein [Pseudoroseomonas vastitatis]MCI0755339.1 hypothetical protein [Pseudoroseomonas vastitatis]
MARFHLPLFPGHRPVEAPDWLQNLVLVGTAGADTLTAVSTTRLMLGLGGDDRITAEGRAEGPGVAMFGSAGNDEITVGGSHNLLSGGAGNDTILLTADIGFSTDSVAFGGAGDDTIFAFGSGNTLFGGSGADRLGVNGLRVRDNVVHGGAGNDTLTGNGFNNRLNGGNGDDVLNSSSFGIGVSYTEDDGAFMTGGAGRDTFNPTNTGLLLVRNDLDGTVSDGDELGGVFNVITDYDAGERIGLGPLLRQEGPVGLVDPRVGPPDYLTPEIEAGRYAGFRGEFLGSGRFMVEEDGPDLMIVTADENVSSGRGALVLQGWSGGDPLIA